VSLSLAACTGEKITPLPNNPDPMMMNPVDPVDPVDPIDPVDPSDPNATTFAEHMLPLLQENCQSCHRLGGIAPFTLTSYEDAKRWAGQMVKATADETMPPFGADDTADCQPRFGFADDLRLSDAEKAVFAKWTSDGLLEGDMSKAPAPKMFDPRAGRLANVDATFSGGAFTTQGSRDQFRCFIIDPQLPVDTFVKGVGFVPGNPAVVHHAIAFLDPDRTSLQHANVGESYDCFAGTGFANTSVLYAWAPGAQPAELGDSLAFSIAANSLIVLQVHYHPLVNSAEVDQSTLELQYFNGRPQNIAQILLIGNFENQFGNNEGLMPGMNDRTALPEFRIPAGVADHVETQRFILPSTLNGFPLPDLKVISAATHMHYVGTGMRWEIEHAIPEEGEPQRECMIETPRWDFQWQRGYAYDVPMLRAPEWRPGDTLHLRCLYNNTMDNPFVAQALADQGFSAPQDVYLGEETLDEMCLAVMTIAFANPF
jgi:hypothetical protein